MKSLKNPWITVKIAPKIGKIVMVSEENLPRAVWKLGKVTGTIEL